MLFEFVEILFPGSPYRPPAATEILPAIADRNAHVRTVIF
jgi:hypothetical protein